jgi:hypothetical protein
MPSTWPLALGAFLLRGGILLVALPIVVLPTPVGLGNVIAPALSSIAFGSIPLGLVLVVVSIVAAAVAWLVAGGWLAAALEAEGTRLVAADEDLAPARGQIGAGLASLVADPAPVVLGPNASGGGAHTAARILAARLTAYLPLGVVLALGSVRLVLVTYRELTSPLDVTTPIVLRVLRGSPEVVIAVVVAWVVAEIVGAQAARHIVLSRASVGGALRHALATLIRHPVSSLVRFSLPTVVLLLALWPSALASAAGLDAIDAVLGGRPDPLGVLLTVVAFVSLWAVSLLLVGVICAWRAAVWTVAEMTREGTFGGSSDRRPGDWRADESSATL